MDDGLRRFKKGEFLFKEGETTKFVYIIKTGKVSLMLERSSKKVDVESLGPSQMCGEQAIFGNGRMTFTAVAASEARVMEVPVELMKAQYEKSGPGVKLIFKSLTECLRQTRNTVKSFRMEQDASPMPQTFIPKYFSILTLVADHAGKKSETGDIELSWGTLKIYVTRMFLESHVRMQGLLELLEKMGFVSLKYEVNDDGEDELVDLVVHNLQIIEDFAEFYQYNLFKGGKAEVIYVDSFVMKVTRAILYCAKDLEVDRRGAVTLNYDEVLKTVKMIFKLELKPLHVDALEKKGLFMKREARDEGVFISFDKAEFERVYAFWMIINQIDKWNQKGHVDKKEPVEEALNESGEQGCPSCRSEIVEGSNFCGNCGHRLAEDAA